MFKKIFKFVKGYVIIEITGKNKERFLNLCLNDGIEIGTAEYRENAIVVSLSAADFMRMRSDAKQSGVKIKIISKHSVKKFALSRKNRIALPIFLIILGIYYVLVQNFIWCVEIDGIKTADSGAVAEILRDKGVYPGAPKSGIEDLSGIKNAIIFSENKINWAWLYVEGAKARLAVQEAVMPPGISDKRVPTDIIAACDGYVREATVKRGERRVVANTTVTKGQVLISGKVAVFGAGEEERYSYVNSEGKITADTVRYARGTFGAKKKLGIKTGRVKKRLGFEFFGKEFFPFGKPENAFVKSETVRKNYDLTLPFIGYAGCGICLCEVYEINEISYTMNKDEVLADAREKLEEEICKGFPHNARRLSQSLSYSESDGKYDVVLRMSLRENIGMKIPIEE